MLVILEGADGSGKTTLYNKLIDYGYLPGVIMKDNKPNSNAYLDCAWSNSVYVIDRSFITDLVYRLNDELPRDNISLFQAADLLNTDNIVIIHCETDTMYEDSMERGEDNITNKDDAQSIKLYYKLIMKLIKKFTPTPVFQYNWKENTVYDVLNFVENNGG